jgi:hypothetical protein
MADDKQERLAAEPGALGTYTTATNGEASLSDEPTREPLCLCAGRGWGDAQDPSDGGTS